MGRYQENNECECQQRRNQNAGPPALWRFRTDCFIDGLDDMNSPAEFTDHSDRSTLPSQVIAMIEGTKASHGLQVEGTP